MIDADAAVLSNYSLRFVGPEERFDAAHRAGFRAVGFGVRQFREAEDSGASASSLRRLADRCDVTVSEIEALKPWWGDAGDKGPALDAEDTAWRMADAFGSRYVQAIGSYSGTLDDAAEAFARVCDRAGEHGAVVGIEFLPFTNIPDAATAAAIVDAAGRPNGGVCVDVWHHFRGARDPEMIRNLTRRRIAAVQVDDGPAAAEGDDYYTDCLENRRVPGEGEFDLVAFIRLLDEMQVDIPVSLEVISTELQMLPPVEAAGRIRRGFVRVLEEARA
ncbi:MAG TPA: sugar phosphate isomerase/epimerase family protein [Acidimicrobiales bacterium]|nr:sugar phosphate isomerase/epimerase family protein [Acidimicrobiales bacterium]